MYRGTSRLLLVTYVCVYFGLKNHSSAKEYNEIRKENIRNCLEKVIKVVTKSDGVKLYKNCLKLPAHEEKTEKISDSDINEGVNHTPPNPPANKSNAEETLHPVNNTFANSDSASNDLVVINFNDIYKVALRQNSDTKDISVRITGNKSMQLARGKTGSNTQLLSYALVPALMIAGIMPWVMPGLQLAAAVVAIINNMAFSSAVFTLIRSYIFDSRPDEHVIYVNHGYKHKKKHHSHY